MKELTLIEAQERLRQLRALAARIKGHHEAAGAFARAAVDRGNEAVREVVLCGQALAAARELVGWGGWRGWLTEQCPGISYETAARWVRVGKLSHVTDLNDAGTVRQLYQLCGILPEGNRTEGTKGTDEWTREWVWRRTAGLAGLAEARVTEWEAAERDQLRERLRPAHELYLALQGD